MDVLSDSMGEFEELRRELLSRRRVELAWSRKWETCASLITERPQERATSKERSHPCSTSLLDLDHTPCNCTRRRSDEAEHSNHWRIWCAFVNRVRRSFDVIFKQRIRLDRPVHTSQHITPSAETSKMHVVASSLAWLHQLGSWFLQQSLYCRC